MIVNEIKEGNTIIKIDDSYMPKTEEERQQRYELFNKLGCEILYSSIN